MSKSVRAKTLFKDQEQQAAPVYELVFRVAGARSPSPALF